MQITLDMLWCHSACSEQVRVFKRLYGNGGRVTKAKCLLGADKLDFDWAARCLLSRSGYRAYLDMIMDAERDYFDKVGTTSMDEWRYVELRYEKAKALAFYKATKVSDMR